MVATWQEIEFTWPLKIHMQTMKFNHQTRNIQKLNVHKKTKEKVIRASETEKK